MWTIDSIWRTMLLNLLLLNCFSMTTCFLVLMCHLIISTDAIAGRLQPSTTTTWVRSRFILFRGWHLSFGNNLLQVSFVCQVKHSKPFTPWECRLRISRADMSIGLQISITASLHETFLCLPMHVGGVIIMFQIFMVTLRFHKHDLPMFTQTWTLGMLRCILQIHVSHICSRVSVWVPSLCTYGAISTSILLCLLVWSREDACSVRVFCTCDMFEHAMIRSKNCLIQLWSIHIP